ncbi:MULTISPECIES: hypothetical protein [Rhizobium]|uniref:hypothetical protein n=1 Tax=Rhizobium TaxID=379 RepID=UPI00240608B0|nr:MULTISPECIES: hypothetical protein [Rhizobium]
MKFITSSTKAIRSMVANGQGVTILSDMIRRAWSLEGELIEKIVPIDGHRSCLAQEDGILSRNECVSRLFPPRFLRATSPSWGPP